MAVSWTEEQQKVIDTRNCNILVSAAAGSGKTAVLVERIIQRITDPLNPVDIDRLLIVTFTRAAAGEMKERIRTAIEKRLEENKDDEHLQRQSVLVHHAQITTIDSFCSYVVKNYFHLIDLDPSFRMGDEGEMRLLQADVAAQVMEEAYAAAENEESGFCDFVDCFGGGKTDTKIEELILKLYEFSMSYPYPKEWLAQCRLAYEIKAEELEEAPFMKRIKSEVKKQIAQAGALLSQAEEICSLPDGPGFYLELLENERKTVENLLKEDLFFSWKANLDTLEFKRLPPGKKAEKELVDETRQELAKNLRNQAKDILKDLQSRYFREDAKEMAENMRKAGEPVGVLVDLTLRFMERYQEKKKEKNILDFADLEHYALEILVEHTPEKDMRTTAAKELSEKYVEIMIDEYQDSNLVQEKLLTAVSKMEDNINNIFMVGDVKQSIYRFRLARPDLFMEKFRTYSLKEGEENLRIDLHKNFRSRAEVLNSVNYLFCQMMGEDLGGVEYDEDAALYPGREFPEMGIEGPAAEVLLFEEDEKEAEENENAENSRELEARMIAFRIREIMENGQVLDKETGDYRPVRFSDFTILLRTMSGWAETFKKILSSCRIPASVTTKTGYFSAPEVAGVLDYLQILDNPRQDIPLAGVLKNMPESFDFTDMAKIKTLGKEAGKEGLFEALLLAEESDSPLGDKVRRFLAVYRSLREKVPYTPIHELIWEFFDATGYLLYQQAFVSGEQKKANLLMLLEKARDYESSSYRGLFNFVRYIENLKKYQVDFGEANILSENEDTVRIMSIHGSKGLEFPIVFVAGMGKQINMQDARESIVFHPDLGIGAPYVDKDLRIRTRTILQRAVQQEIGLESLGEELRILYVALTRAKEKLILTGVVSKLEEKLASFEMLKRQEKQRLPYSVRNRGKSYMDWVLAALARHKSMKNMYEEYEQGVYSLNALYDKDAEFQIRRVSLMELVLDESGIRTGEKDIKEEFLSIDAEKIYEEETRKELEESFSYQYPYEAQGGIPAKLTVSEVKRMQGFEEEEGTALYEKEEEETEYIPAFMREEQEELKGAGRGTAYHRVLECLDYSRTDSLEAVREQLEEFWEKGRISRQVRECVSPRDIYTFAKSSLGKRLKKAEENHCLYREQPFVLGVPARQVKAEYDSDEKILIQGIIDAYFEEEDTLVLVDYKTDRVLSKAPEILIEKYKVQLDYYAEALSCMTGKKVKEKYIYSIYLGREILVS